MTHDPKLIADIEAGKLPLRDLSDRVLVVAGWEQKRRGILYDKYGVTDNYDWHGTNGEIITESHRPHPLASVDGALALLPENVTLDTLSEWEQDGEKLWSATLSHPADLFDADADTAAKAITLAYLRMKNETG